DLLTFFSKNQAFSFTDTPPDVYLGDHADKKLTDIENPDVLKAQLRKLQRVFNVTPRFANIRALLKHDIHSATAMVNVADRKFVETYSEAFGGAGEASKVYKKAKHAHTTALHFYMKRAEPFNSPMPYVMAKEKI